MNMIVVAAHPGWKVAFHKGDSTSVIAWLIRIDENAGAIVVKPLTPYGEPPDGGDWELRNQEENIINVEGAPNAQNLA